MDFETIIVERSGSVGLITLNRPASMNAVCAAMLYELAEAVKAFDAEKDIRVIVLKGTDDFFAAGTDMSEFTAVQNGYEADGIYGNSPETISSCRKPVISAVSGYAFGGGFELVLLSDIVIASDNARFGFPEITLGVLPQLGGVGMLLNRVGRAKAADLLLTGRHISAEEALACGLVSRVVDSSLLLEEAGETARRIAEMPAAGVRLVKQALLKAEAARLIKNEETIACLSLLSADAKEGLAALKENRAPKFGNK